MPNPPPSYQLISPTPPGCSEAKKGTTLYFNDILETGVGGRLRAKLEDGSILALGPQSKLTVVKHDAKTQQSSFDLEYGKVRAQVTGKPQQFDINTKTAVAGVLGTDEVVDGSNPLLTLVYCVEGSVSVRNSDLTVPGTVILTTGQMTTVQQGVAPTAPRTTTTDELNGALEGSGTSPTDPMVDVGTGFATVGQEYLLSAVNSLGGAGTGSVANYNWQIARAQDNVSVYNQTVNTPTVQVDPTTWQPGNYNGTLTVTTTDNKTGQATFKFVVLPASTATASPDEVVQQLKLAYETLQPAEFLRLFDPNKYSGYAALQAAVETSFRNISQIRVFVRAANGQVFPELKTAIYQVDFEIQFSTKAQPTTILTIREQATLRMDSGSGWLISDVPQGSLGGAGLIGIPGTNNPTHGLDVSSTVTGGGNVEITPLTGTGPGQFQVLSGGSSETFVIKNTSQTSFTITFLLPPGITIASSSLTNSRIGAGAGRLQRTQRTGSGGAQIRNLSGPLRLRPLADVGGDLSGPSFTIDPGQTLTVVFLVAPGVPPGTVIIHTIVNSGAGDQPGPDISLTVFQITLGLPSGGSSPANAVPVLLGIGGSVPVQLTSSVPLGTSRSIALTGTGGQVTATFSPNPAVIAAGTAAITSTATLTPLASATPGPNQLTIQGTIQNPSGTSTVNTPLFVNLIVPFTLTPTGPATVSVAPNGSTTIGFVVNCNAPFTGPVTITPPAPTANVSFSPPSQTVNCGATGTFTLTAGPGIVPPTPVTFTGTAGSGPGATFTQPQPVTVAVATPLQFSLTGSSVTLAPGQSGQATVQVALVSGTPQTVSVVFNPASVNGNLISVTGGGNVANASGPITFTVTALANAPPGGGTSFTVTGTAGSIVQQTQVNVTFAAPIQFSLSGPSVTLAPGQSGQVAVQVGLISGTPQTVNVALVPGSVNTSLITVTGGGSVPNASGPANFTVTVQPNAPPGNTSFTVTGTAGVTVVQAQVTVTITGDFSLSGPTGVNLLQNSSTTVSIGVTAVAGSGFNAPVALTATSSNPGITVTGGGGISPGQQAVFTVAASATATGPASITIQGVSGTASHTITIPVFIGSFTVSTNATQPVQLFIGGTATIPITVTAITGFTGNVVLTTAPGSGLTVSPATPVTVNGGNGAQTYTLGTTTTAVAGATSVTVTGTSGGATSSVQVAVQLNDAFTVSSSAAQPIPLFIGGTANLPVTVKAAAGFTGDVTLSAAPPTGVTVSPGGVVKGGSGDFAFTLGTTSDAAPGIVAVIVNATSGNITKTLSVSVQLSNAFTLTSDPATFFLGNSSPLVVHIQRVADFHGSVTLQVGNLPSSITNVTPLSAVVPDGTTSVTFQVTAASDPSLTGQSVTIPITGTASASSSSARFGRIRLQASGGLQAASPGSSGVTINAPGTLQAPFKVSAPNGTSLGTLSTGGSATATVSIAFFGGPPAFSGTVQIAGTASGGVSVTSVSPPLTANGSASVTVSATAAGPFSVQLTSTVGGYSIATSFSGSVSAPPPPPSASAVQFVSPNTSNLTSGSSRTFIAAILDSNGNIMTGFSGSITFTTTAGPGTVTGLPQTVAVSNGDAQVTVTGGSPGSVTLQAASGTLSPSTVTFAVVGSGPGPAFAVQFASPNTSNLTSGSPRTFKANIVDANGATVTGFTGSITFSLTAGPGTVTGLPQTVTVSNGQAQVNVLGGSAGNVTIQAASGTLSAATVSFTVVASGPGPATAVQFVSPNTSNLTSGSPRTFTAKIVDDGGNTVTGYTGSITFSATAGPGTVTGLPQTVTVTNGQAQVSVKGS